MPRTKFSKLPAHIQQRLLERQAGAGSVIIPASRTYTSLVSASLGVGWLLLLSLLSNGFRWNNANIVVFGIITGVAVFFVIRGIHDLLRSAPSRNSVVVTPHYVIDFHNDDIAYQSIEELVTVNSAHKYENGKYKRTQIELTLENGVRTFHLHNLDAAEDVVERIGLFRKHFLEASAKGDMHYLEANDDFRDLPETRNAYERTPGRFYGPLLTSFAALGVGAGIMFAAASANEYFDDVKSWDLARETDRASSYRKYIQTHPNGRWLSESQTRLTDFYEASEAKYRSSLNEDHDEQAVEAILALLRYAKETHNYRVLVRYDRKADIPPGIVERVKEDFGVKKVLSLGDTFTEDQMKSRESKLSEVMSSGFNQVFPDDVLELTSECTSNCATFLVNYEVSFLNSIYYDTKEKDLPREERVWTPGILIDWKFVLIIPNDSREYEFELESVPASEINYDSPTDAVVSQESSKAIQELEQSNFYDAMVTSAFGDFKEHLLFNLGIGPEPKDHVQNSENDPARDRKNKKL